MNLFSGSYRYYEEKARKEAKERAFNMRYFRSALLSALPLFFLRQVIGENKVLGEDGAFAFGYKELFLREPSSEIQMFLN